MKQHNHLQPIHQTQHSAPRSIIYTVTSQPADGTRERAGRRTPPPSPGTPPPGSTCGGALGGGAVSRLRRL